MAEVEDSPVKVGRAQSLKRPIGPAFTCLEQYRNKYENVKIDRDDRGVITVTLHTNGAAPLYDPLIKNQLVDLFWNIGADPDNQIVIYTAAGDSLFASRPVGATTRTDNPYQIEAVFGYTAWNTKHALENLLDIELPIIAAIPGPTRIHAEYGLLCDIVLASDTFVVQDEPHFLHGLVPGDGVHVIWPMLLGPTRARYFMMTGQEIAADEALRLGIINEILPRADLLSRANELASEILRRPPVVRRCTRICHTYPIKRAIASDLGIGIWLEGFAWGNQDVTPATRSHRNFSNSSKEE